MSLAVLLWTGVISAAGITLAAGWGLGAMIARFPPTARNPDVVLSPTDARAVPQVLVLFAALLRSGAPTQIALATVGEVSDGVIGRAFRRAGQELALGAPLGVVARSLGGAVGQDRIGSILARSMDSGAASAQELEQLAQECRRAYLAMAQEQAKRAGVQMVLPLGLCLLPAFVALGIVPIVAALLGDVAW
ncbi:MAG: type II secretion system F family protein [Actinomycetia bacterium]|nr:type II secretion system F family protein [Actinomycetes bacterium]